MGYAAFSAPNTSQCQCRRCDYAVAGFAFFDLNRIVTTKTTAIVTMTAAKANVESLAFATVVWVCGFREHVRWDGY